MNVKTKTAYKKLKLRTYISFCKNVRELNILGFC